LSKTHTRFRYATAAAVAAVLALAAHWGTPVAQSQQSAAADGTTAPRADFQNVWLHYDYMVFPRGWTSLGGVTYPNGLSMAPSPKSIDKVVDAFAAQGLTLHIDPIHNAVPGHQVLIPDFYSDWANPSAACVGPDAVSFVALKQKYFQPHGNHPWHYAVFGFNTGTPDTSLDGRLCPVVQDSPGTGHIDPTSAGMSELPGFNFIVSFGYSFDLGIEPSHDTVGGTFMHELGHNFGLQHGGVLGDPEEVFNYKPNYISVMNYAYQDGIYYAATLGSIIPIGVRLDYSRSALAPLNEADLNEFVGVNAWTTDIVVNSNLSACLTLSLTRGPAHGPIDWNCNGTLELHATADISNMGGSDFLLHGFDDWSYVKQQLQVPPDVIELTPKKLRYEGRQALARR
jgi:Metallo-peptidase family M12B Reprolysin-like